MEKTISNQTVTGLKISVNWSDNNNNDPNNSVSLKYTPKTTKDGYTDPTNFL